VIAGLGIFLFHNLKSINAAESFDPIKFLGLNRFAVADSAACRW
jgi:hypothetical protein